MKIAINILSHSARVQQLAAIRFFKVVNNDLSSKLFRLDIMITKTRRHKMHHRQTHRSITILSECVITALVAQPLCTG